MWSLGIIVISLLLIAFFVAFVIKSIEFLFKKPKWFFIKAAIGVAIVWITYLVSQNLDTTLFVADIIIVLYTFLLYKFY